MIKKKCPNCGANISFFRQFSGKFRCNKCEKQLKSNINFIFIGCAIAAHFFVAGLAMLLEQNHININVDKNLLLLKLIIFLIMFLLGYGLLGTVERVTDEP